MIPFPGAGASLCDRPQQSDWRQGYLPSGSELAVFFADCYAYPEHGPLDFVRVSQYVELTAGDAALYEELYSIFAGKYGSNTLHRLLAGLPAMHRLPGVRTRGAERDPEDPRRRRSRRRGLGQLVGADAALRVVGDPARAG